MTDAARFSFGQWSEAGPKAIQQDACDADGTLVALKTPSTEMRDDPVALERFLLEEWVARRLHDPHVMAAHATASLPLRALRIRRRAHARAVDARSPAAAARRRARDRRPDRAGPAGLPSSGDAAPDLRPENVMIDAHGVVKLIDFGAVHVAGLAEMSDRERADEILGTEQFTAPEYFIGEGGTPASDQFSLGVIVYQILSGRLPYGADASRVRTRAALAKLRYRSVLAADRDIPAWIDGVLRKAVHPDPARRHEALSAFVHALRHPSAEFLSSGRPPWVERDPLRFWKGLSALLVVVVLVLGYLLAVGWR